MVTYGEVEVLNEYVWSASRSCRFTFEDRAPGILWIGGWVGHKDGMDAVQWGSALWPQLFVMPTELYGSMFLSWLVASRLNYTGLTGQFCRILHPVLVLLKRSR
jgi:hypothetical protein